jgi:hypothetical protein
VFVFESDLKTIVSAVKVRVLTSRGVIASSLPQTVACFVILFGVG